MFGFLAGSRTEGLSNATQVAEGDGCAWGQPPLGRDCTRRSVRITDPAFTIPEDLERSDGAMDERERFVQARLGLAGSRWRAGGAEEVQDSLRELPARRRAEVICPGDDHQIRLSECQSGRGHIAFGGGPVFAAIDEQDRARVGLQGRWADSDLPQATVCPGEGDPVHVSEDQPRDQLKQPVSVPPRSSPPRPNARVHRPAVNQDHRLPIALNCVVDPDSVGVEVLSSQTGANRNEHQQNKNTLPVLHCSAPPKVSMERSTPRPTVIPARAQSLRESPLRGVVRGRPGWEPPERPRLALNAAAAHPAQTAP
jgi:hypothetical protein